MVLRIILPPYAGNLRRCAHPVAVRHRLLLLSSARWTLLQQRQIRPRRRLIQPRIFFPPLLVALLQNLSKGGVVLAGVLAEEGVEAHFGRSVFRRCARCAVHFAHANAPDASRSAQPRVGPRQPDRCGCVWRRCCRGGEVCGSGAKRCRHTRPSRSNVQLRVAERDGVAAVHRSQPLQPVLHLRDVGEEVALDDPLDPQRVLVLLQHHLLLPPATHRLLRPARATRHPQRHPALAPPFSNKRPLTQHSCQLDG
mmetsp:Transcript_17038/g.30449  ORF Transcript_17038/g.30449 Transcript_17038/m.30449 type:complete len:253 (+) Transcript_17038:3944-4702(+)